MPAAPLRHRARIRLRRWLAGAVLAVLAMPAAGCQALDGAGPVIDQADLVNDLADRLERSTELTFSAEYRLANGGVATVAQQQRPRRSAYAFPGGMVTVTAEGTTRCRTGRRTTTCTVSPPPSPADATATALVDGADGAGLVPTAAVTDLLTAAGLDAGAVIEHRDTTIAGRHATCVDVAGLRNAGTSRFAACVTTEGVLGSFADLAGRPGEVTMTRFRDVVDPAAFVVPAGATVVDRRPGRGAPPS